MRKSVLLAGSALAVAGLTVGAQKAEAAEISLGMYMPFIIGGADSDNNAENQIGLGSTDTEFYVTGSTTLENGIKVAVAFQFNADQSTSPSTNTDEIEIAITGSFGKIELGHEDGAEDLMNLGATKVKVWAPGSFANTTGVPVNFTQYSGAATSNEAGLDSGDAQKISYYTPRFAGVQVGVSWANTSEIISQTPGSNASHFGAGINYMNTFGDIDVGLAATYWTTDQSTDEDRWSLGAQFGYAGFGLSGQYSQGQRVSGQDVMTWDVGVNYTTGPWGVHLTYEYGEADFVNAATRSGDASMIHAGVSYALGPGITLGAGLGFGTDESDAGSSSGGADKDYTTFTTGIIVSF
jgi:predicted porin